MRRHLPWVAAAVLMASVSACIPHVGHAPRVEPGARYFLTGGVAHVPALQDEQLSIAPSLYLGASRGWVRGNGVAALLGVQTPLLALPFAALYGADVETILSLFLVDAYIQPHRKQAGTLDYGIGTMASRAIVMPYMQLGHSSHRTIYTTQAVAFTFGTFNRVAYWLPSLSTRSIRPDATRAVDFYAHGMIGWQQAEPTGSRTEWAVGIGAVAEFRRRR